MKKAHWAPGIEYEGGHGFGYAYAGVIGRGPGCVKMPDGSARESELAGHHFLPLIQGDKG